MTRALLALFAALAAGCLHTADEHAPLGEICNGVDDDLDRRVDEADPRLCPFNAAEPHARAACTPDAAADGGAAGPCRIERCDDGFVDLDGRFGNGCEYPCRAVAEDDRTCDRLDDDCDGRLDEDPPPAIRTSGVCAGLRQVCSASGWVEPDYRDAAGYRVDPSGQEVACDGLDNDCDDAVDEHEPTLGSACAVGVGACATAAALACAADGQGVACPVAAGTPVDETCNGIDDDCDGMADEGLDDERPCATGLPGRCAGGVGACVDGQSVCRPPAEVEVCNGVDDDCDGDVDEDEAHARCFEGVPRPIPNADVVCQDAACALDCAFGYHDIEGGASDGCEYACRGPMPPIEACNGRDDDCDGDIDEGLYGAVVGLPDRAGVCAGLREVEVCDGNGGVRPPILADAPVQLPTYEPDEVSCDGLDNDCDGLTDEGLAGRLDGQCNGLDDDCDGRVDEDGACPETVCAADTMAPPCNGCPEGTVIPGGDPIGGAWACVPAGEFTLGSPDDEEERQADEGPQVPVAITRPLLVQTHEVTQAQWRAAFDNNPSYFDDCGDDCPVEQVNWFEAVAYVNHLSTEAHLAPCYALVGCAREPGDDMECDPEVARAPIDCDGYRLPTEAEWEYLARGGTQTRFWSGGTEEDLARVGWYSNNSNSDTHPVCTLPVAPPHHPWGLCDVHGNVWEWTESWDGRYPAPPADGAPLADPIGPPRGDWRVIRGGSFATSAPFVRAAYRAWRPPDFRDGFLGFRPVRFAGPPPRAR